MRSVVVSMLALLLAGCAPDGSGGSWLEPQGERWTIECLELYGATAQQDAEAIADALRNTRGIDSKKVWVLAEPDRALIYYGTYYFKSNEASGQREIPPQITRDRLMLKELADDQGRRFFLDSRMVPYPAPDVGNPAWDLRRAQGIYTLQVAVYFNTASMRDRKKAAAEKTRQLREQGYEAYYYHDVAQSMVTVGTFGEDALVDSSKRFITPEGEEVPVRRAYVDSYSREVRDLQKRPECKYNLTNDDIWYGRGKGGESVPVRSMLVRIPAEEDDAW